MERIARQNQVILLEAPPRLIYKDLADLSLSIVPAVTDLQSPAYTVLLCQQKMARPGVIVFRRVVQAPILFHQELEGLKFIHRVV